MLAAFLLEQGVLQAPVVLVVLAAPVVLVLVLVLVLQALVVLAAPVVLVVLLVLVVLYMSIVPTTTTTTTTTTTIIAPAPAPAAIDTHWEGKSGGQQFSQITDTEKLASDVCPVEAAYLHRRPVRLPRGQSLDIGTSNRLETACPN
jgi:hypothetical protein